MKYNIRVLFSDREDDMDFYETLKTDSLSNENISVMKEETSFTKDGLYVIAVHWVEDGISEKDADEVRSLIRGEV